MVDDPHELVVGERGHRREWIDLQVEEQLALEHVANARERALVEERDRDLGVVTLP